MAKVLVTGGTGFVGSHTVAALRRAGHDVRLLVRSLDKVPKALAPHDVTVDDVVEGDVMDRDSLAAAADGCDALLHAANVFSFHPRTHERMHEVNVAGTRIVMEVATKAGLNPIIHVSSVLALIPSDGPVDADSPVGEPDPAYCRSKADAERVAREFQDRGEPVVITNPAAVWGPHDPHHGESTGLLLAALKGQMRVVNDGLISLVDVRDVAEAHARLIDPAFAGRRFILAAHDLQFSSLLTRIGELTGRRLKPLKVPHGAAMALGKAMDWIAHRTGADLPVGYEPPWVLANNAPTDAAATTEALGISWRSLDETLQDMIEWAVSEGLLTEKQAGRAA